MKRALSTLSLLALCVSVQAGFGIQVGAFSPTSGLDDNDNSILLGANIMFKVATFGIKIEGFYVDSSGRYANELGDEFGVANIDAEAILAADFLFYPLGTTFFLQVGVNYVSLDANEILNLDSDIIDNQLGLEGGLGITLFDKFLVQGKLMYTPNAIQSDVGNTLKDLDDNLFGFMVSVGWQF